MKEYSDEPDEGGHLSLETVSSKDDEEGEEDDFAEDEFLLSPGRASSFEAPRKKQRFQSSLLMPITMFVFLMGVTLLHTSADGDDLPTNSSLGYPVQTTFAPTLSPKAIPPEEAPPVSSPPSSTPLSLSPTDAPVAPAPRKTFYTLPRTDRTGAAIKEMLLAHAHAYATNMTYGGACVDAMNWESIIKKKGKKAKKKFVHRLADRKQMIELVGLSDELPIACPTQEELDSGDAVIYRTRNRFKGTGFPNDWFSYLRSKSTFAYRNKTSSDGPLQLVVHIRRGDFTPCHVGDRYLPNVYYLEALDYAISTHCNVRPCNVTIFSEPESYESFEPFRERNYTVDLVSPPPKIWPAILNADIFIMSMSSFSFVPSSVSHARVITMYTGIPHWNRVPSHIYYHALRERRQQQTHDNCTNMW